MKNDPNLTYALARSVVIKTTLYSDVYEHYFIPEYLVGLENESYVVRNFLSTDLAMDAITDIQRLN